MLKRLSAGMALLFGLTALFHLGRPAGAGAAAPWDLMGDLNQGLVELLKPFQNERTRAVLGFKRLDLNDERVLGVEGEASFWKIGPSNELRLRMEQLSYDYGSGRGTGESRAPMTRARGTLSFDLLKLMTQEQLNDLSVDAAALIREMAKTYAEPYGEAALIEAEVLDKRVDANGNIQELRLAGRIRIDLDKLPSSMPRDSVVFGAVNVGVILGLQGGAFEFEAVSNLEYSGFRKGQEGLKEGIEKILKREQEALDRVVEAFKAFDEFAEQLVHTDANQK